MINLSAMAQDHVYSQFFNAPIYLNPSLTGQFEGDIRMNLIYRNQWSGLSGDLSYITASADLNISKFAGGVGLMFNRSSEGTAYLVKNNAAATYSYSVGGDDFIASFGIQAGITSRQIDWSKLVFSDQIDMRLGYIPGSVSSAQPLMCLTSITLMPLQVQPSSIIISWQALRFITSTSLTNLLPERLPNFLCASRQMQATRFP